MDKIIFFNMNQLGDMLFALPIMQAVKQTYPKVKTYCVIKENLKDLIKTTGLVDEIFVKKSSFLDKIKLISKIKNEHIDTAVLFSESPESLLTAFCSRIKHRYGFKTASLNFLLTNKANKTGVPSLKNNIELGSIFGLQNIQTNYCNILKEDNDSKLAVEQWLKENNIDQNKYIVISMGASAKRQEKCLPEQTWIQVINELGKKNIPIIISCASWEKAIVENLVSKCTYKPHIFCNGLLKLVSLLKKSKIFIGIDSGIMHLAASLGVKCLGIFGKTDPLQIGPQPLESHIIIKNNNIKEISYNDIVNKVIA